MAEDVRYSAQQVRAALKLSQRRLDYWDELGIVSPKRAAADRGSKQAGRGNRRLYSFDDLVRLRLVKGLRDAGLSLQKIQKCLRMLRKRQPASDLLNKVLLTDGRSFQWMRADGTVEDLLANGQMIFSVVSLQPIEREVREQILRISRPTRSRRAVS